MSKASCDRVEEFLVARAVMRGIDHNEVAAVHRGDETREAVLETADLLELVEENQRMRDALRLLIVNSSLSSHQLEIINGAIGA